MLPMVNFAMRGVVKFIYTISSTFGSNLFKLTLGTGLSDEENFLVYFDKKLKPCESSWFQHSLNTMNE